MDERLKKQLEFVLEIDKEKNIFRQTHLSGQGRNENDAEHAWHMAIMAYLLREYANEPVDNRKGDADVPDPTISWRSRQEIPMPMMQRD